jgi:hypothetical protein
MSGRRLARIIGCSLITGAAVSSASAQALTATQLQTCLAAQAPASDFAQRFTLNQTQQGQPIRRLAGEWRVQRAGSGHRSVLKLSAPPELAGSAYLFVRGAGEPEVHLYVPATRKARRVNGSTVARSLFGTGLSAFDLQFALTGLEGGSFVTEGATTLQGRAVERWRYTPPARPELLYDRVDLVIDTARCLPLEARFFGGTPWKTFTVASRDVVASGQGWRIRRAVLDDLRSGTRTTLDLAAPAPLPEGASFEPNRFHR